MNENICRVCSERQGSIYIYGVSNGYKLDALLMYCCPNIAVQEGDGLPSHICTFCEKDLVFCYKFVLKCEGADKKLRSLTIENLECEPKPEVKTEEAEDSRSNDLETYDEDHGTVAEDFQDNNEAEFKIEKQALPKTERIKKKTKNAQVYKCIKCDHICSNAGKFEFHMRTHSEDLPYHCTMCSKKYKTRGTLKSHIERNHNKNREKRFMCETCGKKFYTKNEMKIHLRTHTGDTPYKCTECPMRFTQISAMLRHKKRHTGEKSFICSTCSKKFCTKEELKNHQIVHTNNKEYSCPICYTAFKYKSNRQKHVKLHSEPTSFICNHCGQNFSTKGNLKIHINRRHSEKSGFCNVCSKNVSNIEAHSWKHTGERPLKCDLCTSRFYELKALSHHMSFRHKNPDKYKCSVDGCLMSFPSRPMLEYHTAKLHETSVPFPCDRCPRGFYRKNDLARHKLGTHKEKI